jgi:hypothetical protein
MKVRAAFLALAIAFSLAVLGAAVATSKSMGTHQAKTDRLAARPSG